ncbi:hypothetical protein X975_05395, partial [Stegodyphus mimosarum]
MVDEKATEQNPPAGASSASSNIAPIPILTYQLPRSPCIFTGDGQEDTNRWLKDFDRIANYNHWDDQMCLANVIFYLAGTARQWFDNNEDTFTSWTVFRNALKNAFSRTADVKRQAERLLLTRAQQIDETSEAYIQDVLSLCRKANPSMSEDEKVAHLMKGIAEDLYQVLSSQDYDSVDAFVKRCRHIESLRRRRIARPRFQRLPNVSAVSADADAGELESLVRAIVRQELQKFLPQVQGYTKIEPVASNDIASMVREEVIEALAPLTGAERSKNTIQCSLPVRPQPRHEISQRTTPQRRTDLWRTDDNVPLCFHCGRPGHVLRYCRERRQIFENARAAKTFNPRRDRDTDSTYGGEAADEENPPTYTTAKLKKNTTFITVNGQCVKALVDSGADYSVISEELRRQLNAPMFTENGPILKTACGKPVAASGRCVLKVDLNGTKRPFEFLVFPECSHQIILGWNFFRATDAVIDCGNQELQLAEILPDNEYLNKSESSLFAATDYLIEANTTRRICALSSELQEADGAMIVGNRFLMCEKELSIPASIVTIEDGCGKLWVTNCSRRTQLIPKGMNVGCLTSIKNDAICSLSGQIPEGSKGHRFKNTLSQENLKEIFGTDLTNAEKDDLLSLLDEFSDVFDFNSIARKSRCNAVKHRIDTGDSAPIKGRTVCQPLRGV